MAQNTIPFRRWMECTDESVMDIPYLTLAAYKYECLRRMKKAEKEGQIEVYRSVNKFLRIISKELNIRDISPRRIHVVSQEKALA